MRYTVLIAALVASISVLGAGCTKKEGEQAKPGTPGAAKVQVKLPAEMTALQDEVTKGTTLLDKVMASLDTVIAAADKNPTAQFGEYKKDLAALESQVTAVRSRSDAMKAKGADYFKSWETQLATIATPAIKAAAEKRKDEIGKDYTSILEKTAKTRESYDGIFTTLQDFGKILENDLNAEGIKALAPKVAPVKEKIAALKTDLDGVLGSLKKIASIYSPGA